MAERVATHYEDRCTVDGCPEPNSEEWHRCFIDSCQKMPIHHHHFPSRAQAGKGAKIVAALCPKHHDKISLNRWREGIYTHPDGSVRYYVQNEKGEQQCERIIEAAPITVDTADAANGGTPTVEMRELSEETLGRPVTAQDMREWLDSDPEETLPAVKEEEPIILSRVGPPDYTTHDLSNYSDEDLATVYAFADKNQKDSFLTKCHVIHAYRERHVQAWGSSWIEQAYQLFEGSPSRRTLEAYANIWGICVTSDANLLEHIGPLTDSRSLMQFIGRKNPEDGRVALEAAVAHIAEFGEAPTVPALAQKLGEESKPSEPCPSRADGPHEWERVCKWCRAVKEKP